MIRIDEGENCRFCHLVLHAAKGQQVPTSYGALAHNANRGCGVRVAGIASSVNVVVASIYVSGPDKVALLLTRAEYAELVLLLRQATLRREAPRVPLGGVGSGRDAAHQLGQSHA